MGADIIWHGVSIGCALLFVGIGIYAIRRDKPMWFWSGSTVDPESITDVKAYNKANGIMWLLYSLWYWGASVGWCFNHNLGIALLMLGSTLGGGLLAVIYTYIHRKYKK